MKFMQDGAWDRLPDEDEDGNQDGSRSVSEIANSILLGRLL